MVFLLVWSGLAPAAAQAQELNCKVQVDYSQLSGSDYSYLRDFGLLVQEYFNQRNWTNDRFLEYERIDCDVNIVFVEALTLTSFRASIVVTTARPIYATTATTNVFTVGDNNWQFEYNQGAPLIFEPDRFHPLTSVLNFYAYVMLGYDYDTFSPLGGTPHFERARRVAELAELGGAVGWNQLGGDRSRGQLIEELLDPRYQALREVFYTYHFEGLDQFIKDQDEAREAVLQSFSLVQELFDNYSRFYIFDLFFSTKYREIASMFERSQQGPAIYDILTIVDPAHTSDYGLLLVQ